jgi:hypothetical protein
VERAGSGYAGDAPAGHRADHRPAAFGLPDWLKDFQNPEWPDYFAEYAHAFAERYPWVRYYTPVNEIYVTAIFSGLYGWWNERLMSDHAFVTNVKHCCKASILAMRAILGPSPGRDLRVQRKHGIRPSRQPRHGAAGALHERPAVPIT